MADIHRSDLAFGLAGMSIMRRLPNDTEGIQDARSLLERALGDSREEREGWEAREMDPAEGYAEWAPVYDATTNAMIAVEEPVIDAILESLDPTTALDAACGTGRHTRRLVDLGWEVRGVDASPEMLDVARAKLPGVQFDTGDLRALPIAEHSVDLVVCGLALTHVDELRSAIGEFARVTAPGGSIITTDIHPFAAETGAHAFYARGDGGRSFIRNRTHWHSEYLDAFAAFGLEVIACEEPTFRPEVVSGDERAVMARLLSLAVGGLPGVLIWHCRVR